jgi:KDO2-lipid IV(A) lauroyltransferase
MKKIAYLLEFILIKILFILFLLIGYRLSSNLGFVIGRTIGPIFRSKKIIIQNLEKANIKHS